VDPANNGLVWEKKPLQKLFGRQESAPLQKNGHDCGAGACLLVEAVVKQFGMTGASKGLTGLLETPLRHVRMQMALHYITRAYSPPAPEYMEIDQ
jgi:Ulp1 family protease